MKEYLQETICIDYRNPIIVEKVSELKKKSKDAIDYVHLAYEFVRDEIPHSWDIQTTIVSRKASDVLINKTGICWMKSCLLAALLRANSIPSGISYQKLTLDDEDDSKGYVIHALNTVYIQELKKWIRLDARGNKENVHAQFSLDQEILAFPIRECYKEIDYRDNHSDLDPRLIEILEKSENILEVHADFEL